MVIFEHTFTVSSYTVHSFVLALTATAGPAVPSRHSVADPTSFLHNTIAQHTSVAPRRELTPAELHDGSTRQRSSTTGAHASVAPRWQLTPASRTPLHTCSSQTRLSKPALAAPPRPSDVGHRSPALMLGGRFRGAASQAELLARATEVVRDGSVRAALHSRPLASR